MILPKREDFIGYIVCDYEYNDIYTKIMNNEISQELDNIHFDAFISFYFNNKIEIKSIIHLLRFLICIKNPKRLIVVNFLEYYLFQTKEIINTTEDIVYHFLDEYITIFVYKSPILHAAFYRYINPQKLYNDIKEFEESKYQVLKEFLGDKFEQYMTIYTLRGMQ